MTAAPHPLYVTRPLLPPLEEFIPYLEEIWRSGILTNAGPMHAQLERALSEHLGVDRVVLFANGMLALVTALRALQIRGEVVTTPYSFVATPHSLIWNDIEPVFADIDPETFNLDPACIEAAITPRTTAILPVHCYGQPCDTAAIQDIADRHGLRVIYDAAHAFGVTDEGGSILRHGELSMLSFHATKVFNTFEGGAIACSSDQLCARLSHLKNFGIENETSVPSLGINGKLNEVSSAFGLLQLMHIDAGTSARRRIALRYADGLRGIAGIKVPDWNTSPHNNHGYFPILVTKRFTVSRDDLYTALRTRDIFARRYFYPLLSSLPMYAHLPSSAPDNLPVAHRVARQILCLPIFPDMTDTDVDRVLSALHDCAAAT